MDNLKNKWLEKQGGKSCGDLEYIQIWMNTFSEPLILLAFGILSSILLLMCEIFLKQIYCMNLKNEESSTNEIALERENRLLPWVKRIFNEEQHHISGSVVSNFKS